MSWGQDSPLLTSLLHALRWFHVAMAPFCLFCSSFSSSSEGSMSFSFCTWEEESLKPHSQAPCSCSSKFSYQRDFPDGPVVKALCSAGGVDSIFGLRTRSHMLCSGAKDKNFFLIKIINFPIRMCSLLGLQLTPLDWRPDNLCLLPWLFSWILVLYLQQPARIFSWMVHFPLKINYLSMSGKKSCRDILNLHF